MQQDSDIRNHNLAYESQLQRRVCFMYRGKKYIYNLRRHYHELSMMWCTKCDEGERTLGRKNATIHKVMGVKYGQEMN